MLSLRFIPVITTTLGFVSLSCFNSLANAATFQFSGEVLDFTYVKIGNGPNPPEEFEIGAVVEIEYSLANIADPTGSFSLGIDSYIVKTNDDILSGTRNISEVVNGFGSFLGSGNLDGTFEISILASDSGFTVTDPLGIEGEMPVDLIISRSTNEPDFMSIAGFVNELDDSDTCNFDPGNVPRCFEGSWFGATVAISSSTDKLRVPEPAHLIGLGGLAIASVFGRKRRQC